MNELIQEVELRKAFIVPNKVAGVEVIGAKDMETGHIYRAGEVIAEEIGRTVRLKYLPVISGG